MEGERHLGLVQVNAITRRLARRLPVRALALGGAGVALAGMFLCVSSGLLAESGALLSQTALSAPGVAAVIGLAAGTMLTLDFQQYAHGSGIDFPWRRWFIATIAIAAGAVPVAVATAPDQVFGAAAAITVVGAFLQAFVLNVAGAFTPGEGVPRPSVIRMAAPGTVVVCAALLTIGVHAITGVNVFGSLPELAGLAGMASVVTPLATAGYGAIRQRQTQRTL